MEASRPHELIDVATFVARMQRRPEHHVAYLATDAATIAAEIEEETDDWREAAAVMIDGDELVGCIVGSVDHAMGRVWWFGPFVDRADPAEWRRLADELDRSARAGLAADVVEEEYAVDERNTTLTKWAVERGGTVDTGSAVLVLDGEPIPPEPSEGTGRPAVSVRPMLDTDASAVVPMHETLFPGTHLTGAALVVAGDHVRLVVEVDRVVAGYVAVELQADGEGYIDYLGVDPEHRRRGLGALLIRRGIDALRGLGAGRVSLTVRVDNHGARALYRGLGFTEERILVPIRSGFSLG